MTEKQTILVPTNIEFKGDNNQYCGDKCKRYNISDAPNGRKRCKVFHRIMSLTQNWLDIKRCQACLDATEQADEQQQLFPQSQDVAMVLKADNAIEQKDALIKELTDALNER